MYWALLPMVVIKRLWFPAFSLNWHQLRHGNVTGAFERTDQSERAGNLICPNERRCRWGRSCVSSSQDLKYWSDLFTTRSVDRRNKHFPSSSTADFKQALRKRTWSYPVQITASHLYFVNWMKSCEEGPSCLRRCVNCWYTPSRIAHDFTSKQWNQSPSSVDGLLAVVKPSNYTQTYFYSLRKQVLRLSSVPLTLEVVDIVE